jgi:hypothetical protein
MRRQTAEQVLCLAIHDAFKRPIYLSVHLIVVKKREINGGRCGSGNARSPLWDKTL